MATTPPFIRLDANGIPEDGPSLAAFPAPFTTVLDGAPPFIPVSGFSGVPATTGDFAYRFGSLVKYGFSVGGLTAAAGANVAQIGVPVNRLGPFLAARQAYGSLSALSDSGALMTGSIQAVPGGNFLLLTLANGTGAPQSLVNFELQAMVTYHLTG